MLRMEMQRKMNASLWIADQFYDVASIPSVYILFFVSNVCSVTIDSETDA